MGSSGGGGQKASGGSPTGKVDYPTYLKEMHKTILVGQGSLSGSTYAPFTSNYGVVFHVEELINNSPYEQAAAFDPSDYLTDNQTRYDTFDAVVQALNEQTDWVALYNTGRTQMGSNTAFDVATLEDSAQTIFDLDNRIDYQEALEKVEAQFDYDALFDFPALLRSARSIVESSDLDWEDMLERIQETADQYIVPEDVISDLVSAFEADSYLAVQKRYTDAAAQMADMGAVRSSTFTGMRSRLISEHLRNTNRFSAEIRTEQQRLRVQAITSQINNLKEVILAKLTFLVSAMNLANQILIARYDQIDRSSNTYIRTDGIQAELVMKAVELLSKNKMMQYEVEQKAVEQLSRLLINKIQANAGAVQLQGELNRVGIVAQTERYNRDLEIDTENLLWNIKLFQYPANTLAAIGGGSVIYEYDRPKTPGSSGSQIAGNIFAGLATIAGIASAFTPN